MLAEADVGEKGAGENVGPAGEDEGTVAGARIVPGAGNIAGVGE